MRRRRSHSPQQVLYYLDLVLSDSVCFRVAWANRNDLRAGPSFFDCLFKLALELRAVVHDREERGAETPKRRQQTECDLLRRLGRQWDCRGNESCKVIRRDP